MKRLKSTLSLASLLLAAFFFSGCEDLSGVYHGYASLIDGGSVREHPISIWITPGSNGVHLESREQSESFLPTSFDIVPSGDGMDLVGVLEAGQALHLVQDQNSRCYRASQPRVLACLDDAGFHLEAVWSAQRQLRIWTQKGGQPARTPVLGGRRTYTVDELRSASVVSNFENRQEYERVIRARRQAEAAAKALAPRLTINGVAGVLTGGVTGILGAIGDFAPFLFPSNWYEARTQAKTAEAEAQSRTIMKLNTALQVESTANLIIRDTAIIAAYRSLMAEIARVRAQVDVRERVGQYPPGSTDNLDSITNALRQDLIALTHTRDEELRSLALMVGFSDVSALQGVDWARESRPIASPYQIDGALIAGRAVELSPEMHQAVTLIEAAQMDLQKTYWSWLDPSGGPGTGLGLPTGSLLEISRSKLRDLQIQSQQIYAITRQKALKVADELDESHKSFTLAAQTLQIQQRRKEQFVDKIGLGVRIDFFGFLQVLQDYLKTQVDQQNAIASYRSARASAQRLLMDDFYGRLP